MKTKIFSILVFFLTTVFYIYTLSPSLAWGDGTRLQSEAISGESIILSEMPVSVFSPDPFIFSKVSVTAWDHPLYIVLGHLLVKALPFVNSLWLVNLISAIFGTASVVLVFQLCYRHTNSLLASSYAAFALAVSHTFWWHSSTPEVYTLFTFLLLVSYLFFDKFEQNKNTLHLFLTAFFLGLAASNHILAFLAFPALGLYFVLSRNIHIQISGWRKMILPLFGFLLGFSLYIIQFIRITRSLPFNEIAGSLVGSTFLSGLSISPLVLGESLLKYLFFLLLQFGLPGIVLSIIGIRKGFENKKILSFYIVYMLFGVFYRVSDQFAFFLTSYVFFAILMGLGLNHLLKTLDEKPRFVLTFILLLTIILTPLFYIALPTLADRFGVNDASLDIPKVGTGVRDGLAYYINPYKHGDYEAHDFGIQTLNSLPPNAVVIAEWYTDTDEYFVLRYFNKVESVRPDVTVLGWMTVPPASFDPQLMLDIVEESLPDRPVYLASLSDRFYASSSLIEMYCIVPENNLYRLHPKDGDSLQCLGIDSITE
ncbi:MAG TPA: DUF2723 domain-containing protein [Anaerolineales bacterium]|nr:DUF2723 domain-containing protein [Anaerolineales bacterium]